MNPSFRFKKSDITAAIQWLIKESDFLLNDKEYECEIRKDTKKRSLDANRYAWVLLGKMADALTLEAQGETAYTKDDVYIMMLQSYGQTATDEDGVPIVFSAAAGIDVSVWHRYVQEIGDGYIDGNMK